MNVNKSYVQAAKVYLKPGNDLSIVIKCCLCNIDGLTEWSQFSSHLAVSHAALKSRLIRRRTEQDEEIEAEVEIELQNQRNCERCETEESDVETEVLEEQLDLSEAEEVLRNSVDNKPKQPFYSLQQTEPKLMLCFIDLLRQHEYLWRNEFKNIDFKTERLESAQEISKCLARGFDVKLMPQVICLSARALLNWFKRQYALQLSNPGFRCRHSDYYEMLLQFVPIADITVINCDECQRRFINEDQLRRHKHRFHFASCPYVCEVCQKVFAYASKLRSHQNRFHTKFTRWNCDICRYSAPNKWDLKLHRASHSGERNFTCELCGVSTKSSSSLAVHRRTHLDPQRKCPYCPKEYRESYVLKCHIAKSHSEEDT